MTKPIKRAVRVIRGNSKNPSNKKTLKRQRNNKNHGQKQRGGAVYSFDFNDKIGGMPVNVSLNGTADGDCPSNVSELGFSNYGTAKGGNRKMNKSRKSKKSRKTVKSQKSKKSKKSKHSRK